MLLDINMPGKDGFQASTEMRKIEVERGAQKRARIVAVTALSAEGDKRRGMLECGIGEFEYLHLARWPDLEGVYQH